MNAIITENIPHIPHMCERGASFLPPVVFCFACLYLSCRREAVGNMAEGGSPRKAKRTAERQINKDEDPEGDGGGEDAVAGTFQRASADVLKTRK